MEFLTDYGLFLAKTITIIGGSIAVIITIFALASRSKEEKNEHIEIKKLNDKYAEIEQQLKAFMATKSEAKQLEKEHKAKLKADKKNVESSERQRIFVLNFHGDMRAGAVSCLREEITAILTIARKNDEVFLRLDSAGGLVHAYGLAASQLQRIKDNAIHLTISVDKVAASGGYLMACLANKIIAAPFAVLGSIGVVAQIPNFNRLMKKHDIDYELITAGQYKRTLTSLGENTDAARSKFKEDIEDTHLLFKEFVKEHRPVVDIDQVSTGEHWFGTRAQDIKLVDELKTSDDYLLKKSAYNDLYEITYTEKKKFGSKLALFFSSIVDKVLVSVKTKYHENQLP